MHAALHGGGQGNYMLGGQRAGQGCSDTAQSDWLTFDELKLG